MLGILKFSELNMIYPAIEKFLNLILDRYDDLRVENTEYAGLFLVQLSLRNGQGKLPY